MHAQKELAKQFMAYLLPSVASLVSLSFYILADTYFIAAGVGSLGLTALNIAIPGYSIITALGLMLGVGGGVLVAVNRGLGDQAAANRVFQCAVAAAVLIGLLVTLPGALFAREITVLLGASEQSVGLASQYLRILMSCAVFFILNNTLVALVRNDGNPRLAMASMVANSLTNVALDYVFVIRLGWGMPGAAAATCLSPVMGIGILSLHWITGRNGLRFSREIPRLSLLGRIVQGGASNFLLELGNGLVIFLFNAAMLGLAGDVGVAAYGIVANIALVIGYVFIGVGQGVQPVLSQQHGAGNRLGCHYILRLSLLVSAVLGILFYLVGLFFPEQLTALFNSEGNRELARLTERGIPLYFLSFLIMGLNISCAAYFQSTMRPLHSIVISVLRSVGLIALGVAVFPRLGGVTGVWLVAPFAESGTLLVCVALLLAEKRREGGDTARPLRQ